MLSDKEKIKEMLLKYTDPKLQYDGLTADELAKMILEALQQLK